VLRGWFVRRSSESARLEHDTARKCVQRTEGRASVSTVAVVRGPAEEPVPILRRSLGLGDVALFFIVTGSNLQWVATAAAAGASSLTVWLFGLCAMFAPLAICVVFLCSHHPDEGGMYVWSKRAFGPFAGFMTGWTYWTSNLTYFPALLYFTAGNAVYVTGGAGALASSAPYFIAVSLAGLALGTGLNVLGLGVGKWLNNAGAISRWAVTMLLIGLGIFAWWKFGPATPINASSLRPGFALKDIIFWSVIAFAWTGPEAISFVAGEVRNPRRSIPMGLLIGGPVIALIYVMGTFAVLASLAPSAVDPSSGVMQSIAHVASRAGWSALTPLAAILVVLSCLGSVGAWLGAAARIPFVAGIDRYLPDAFGRMHPRWGSPVAALLTQAVITAVFIVLGQGGTSVKGAYDVLVSSTVIVTLIPFLYLFAAAIRLYTEPSTPDMVRIPGGKPTIVVAALIGLFTTACAIALAGFPANDDPNKPLAVAKVVFLTALLVGSGVVAYILGEARKRRAEAALG
jgi:glutamate:GABA antiporter